LFDNKNKATIFNVKDIAEIQNEEENLPENWEIYNSVIFFIFCLPFATCFACFFSWK